MPRWLTFGCYAVVLVVLPLLDVIDYPPWQAFAAMAAAAVVAGLCFPVYLGLKEPPRHD